MHGVRLDLSAVNFCFPDYEFKVEAEPPLDGVREKAALGWFKRWKFRFQWMPTQGRPWWMPDSHLPVLMTSRPNHITQVAPSAVIDERSIKSVTTLASDVSPKVGQAYPPAISQLTRVANPTAPQADILGTIAPQFDL